MDTGTDNEVGPLMPFAKEELLNTGTVETGMKYSFLWEIVL